MTVQEYIEKRKKEFELQKTKEKRQKLYDLGLYEKEYSPVGQPVDKNKYPEYDNVHNRSFRYIYGKISDEDYNELLLLDNPPSYQEKSLSILGTIIVISACLCCLVSLVFGIILVVDYDEEGWVLIVSSILLLPFGVGLGLFYRVVADISNNIKNKKS